MSADARLPAHLEVAGLIRSVNAAGGFASVLQVGDKDVGAILLLTIDRGDSAAVWERLPRLDGTRPYTKVAVQGSETPQQIEEYCSRRARRDTDLWVIEVDVPFPERFIETREP